MPHVPQRDDVLRILATQPDGLTDAEVARELKRLHPKARHQTANQHCRALAAEGLIARDSMDSPIMNRLIPATPPPGNNPDVGTSGPRFAPTAALQTEATAARSWPWEGAVQAAVVRWLTDQSGQVLSQADTASKQRGTDIVAEVASRKVHVEVKGWPSSTYADPRRAAETKRTPASVQAAQWYAGAMSTALGLRQAHPGDRVAVALPDKPRYRTLYAERAEPLQRIGIELWFVAEDGMVVCFTTPANARAELRRLGTTVPQARSLVR